MAKQQAAAPAPAPLVPPTAKFNQLETQTAEVVEWGNGGPKNVTERPIAFGGDEPAKKEGEDGEKTPAETPAGKEAPAEEAEPEPAKEGEEPATAKPAPNAEKREQIRQAIERQKQQRSIESQIAAEKKRADDAVAESEKFNKSPLGKKLAIIASQHGMSVEDLKDKLLIGAEDVTTTETPAAAAPAQDPKVAELLKWKEEREAREGQERVATAINGLREDLKDADLPMVDSLDAYGRVMVKAHDAWIADGKKGTVRDYVPDAAVMVEDELKEESPRLAARLYPAAAAEDADEPAPAPRAAPPPTRPRAAVGRRAAPRANPREEPLPYDRQERDKIIKKLFFDT